MMEVGRKRRIGRGFEMDRGGYGRRAREMTGIFCASRVRGGLRLVLSCRASLQDGWHACSYWVMIGYGHGR